MKRCHSSSKPRRRSGAREPKFSPLRFSLAAFTCLAFASGPAGAATVIWDAGSTTDLAWSTATNWDGNTEPTGADDVVLPKPIPNPGVLTNPHIITLTAGETANSVSFFSPYTLTGGDLDIATGQIAVTIGNASTIESKLTGTSGLLKLNDGALKLTNAANDYTGTTQIDAGSVIITDQGALGADASAIVVRGNATRGSGGGSLVVGSASNNLTGLTFTRDLALTGGGASGDGAAFNSVGNNTFSGDIVTGGDPAGLSPVSGVPITVSPTRLASTFGTTTFNGAFTIDPTGQTTEITGNGNMVINSNIDGLGNLSKSGAGLLVLAGSNTFAGTLTATTGGGFVRLGSAANLGANTGNGALTISGGKVEFRTDAPDFTTANRITFGTSGTANNFYLDRAIGGSGLNQTITYGLPTLSASTTARVIAVNSRNGYGITFTGNMASGSQGALTSTNNGNGLLTWAGDFYNTTNGTVRALTFSGNGDQLVTGSILASGAAHTLTKSGTGTLRINGTASTYSGATTVSAGTLAINDFRAVTNNTAAINIGATGTGATLSVVGNNLAGADLTTSKVINLAGTTGGATLLANQTGTSPGLTLNAAFTAIGVGAKTLTLGGTNTADNTINGAIVDNGGANTTSLTKINDGVWALGGTNTYTGATTVADGTLKILANAAGSTIVADTSAITFNVFTTTQTAGGTLEFVGQDNVSNVENLGALTPTQGANTIVLSPGAGTGTASLIFSSLGAIGDGASVNIVGADAVNNTVTLTGVADGLVAPQFFFGGSEFAYADTAVLRAPVYGGDGGFSTSATALTTLENNEITGSFSNAAETIATLKINGSQTLTLTGLLTIRTGAAGTDGAILQTGGGGVITGNNVTTGGAGNLAIRVDGLADVLTLNGTITSTTTAGFTKSGKGTLVFAGVNAQTGTNAINDGTVQLSGSGRLSANSAALILRQGATLDLNGVTTSTGSTTASISAFNGAGTVTNTSATPVLFAVGGGTSGGTGTFSGAINEVSGQISVIKKGTTNSQTWSGISNYTGSTTIGVAGTATTGSLTVTTLADIGDPSSIGRGDDFDTASNRASLVFNGTTAGLTYTGAASVSTDRLFTLGGTGASAGATITNNGFNNATLIFSNPNAIGFGAGTVQLFTLGGSSTGDNLFSPVIPDNGANVVSFSKTGAGLWKLGGANTYTGATTITAGALVAESGAIDSGSTIVLNGGVLQSSDMFTRGLTPAPAAGAGGINWSANGGFAASTSKLTVNIGGALGTLTWGTGGFVSGTLILSSSTALAEVDILNPINLAGAVRTIQVDVNSTTNSDLATLTGAVSGAAGSGLTKTGSGILRLLAANDYVGDTAINAGTVRAVDIGNSTSASSNFGTGAGKITIGSGSTTGTLAYVGGGETTDRLIELSGTTASAVIESSGSGALILTSVTNASTGASAKTLFLRGDLNAANEITSALANNGDGGVLNVTKDDNGTWILSGQSTFTGNMTASAGPLGLAIDSTPVSGSVTSGPVGAGLLIISNGSIFALNGARTIANDVRVNGAASANFIGINSLTFNGALSTTTGGNTTITNSLPAGELLTFNAPTYTGTEGSTARTLVFNGGGDTILNSSVTNSTGGATINLTYNGYGSLTLGGSNGASTYTGATTLTSGTLKVGSADAIPNGATAGNVTINPGTALAATLDLNGFNQTINGLTASSLGTANIDNSSATAATFTFGSQDQASTLVGNVLNSGAGTLSLTKIGTAAASFSGGTYAHTGATSVQGGVLTFGGDVSATTSLSVTGSTLSINGGFSGSTGVTSLTVNGGSTLGLNFDDAGTPLSSLTTLSLGAGAGTATLRLNIGDGATDTITLVTSNSPTFANTVTFNMTDSGLSPLTTYTLMNIVDGGIAAFGIGNMIQGITPGGFDGMTWFVDDNLVQITTGNALSGDSFWRGLSDTTWNGAANNWSDDKAGTIAAAGIPGAGTDVIFAWDNPGAGALSTTLEQNFKINSLTFEAGATTTPSSITIASGADPSFRLQVAPGSATDGVKISAGGTPSVTISSPFKLGAAQTWSVADAASVLTFGGALDGEVDWTVSGSGTIILGAAAATTFNTGQTSDVTITGGTLRLDNGDALGATINANAATVVIGATGAFYATAGSPDNAIDLAGGTLSVGDADRTYEGNITVSADSFINAREFNSSNLPDEGRTITITGLVTGANSLTLSAEDDGEFNSLDGLVLFDHNVGGVAKNVTKNFSGTLNLNQGEFRYRDMTVADANFQTTGAINFKEGKLGWDGGLGGDTLAMTNRDITIANGATNAVGELNVDRGSGTGVFAVSFDSLSSVTLGDAAGGTGTLRLFLSDGADGTTGVGNTAISFAGAVTLEQNGTISVRDNAQSTATFSGGIGESGGARNLTVGDTTWGGTAGVLNLTTTAAGYTGATILELGTLRVDAADRISAANLDFAGGGISASAGGITLANNIVEATADQILFNGYNDNNLTLSDSFSIPTARTFRTTGDLFNTPGTREVVTFTGAITASDTTDGTKITLEGNTSGGGVIAGGITHGGTAGDMVVGGGEWTFQTTGVTVPDDLTVTTSDAILNLNSAGVLTFGASTNASLRATNGGTINLGASNAVTVAGFDGLRLGVDAGGAAGVLNMNAFNQTVTEFILGNRASDREGLVDGSGILTVTANLDLYEGTINANLASTGSTNFEKLGPETVTLKGDNSGLASTGDTLVHEGTLVFDYTASNTTKVKATEPLDMRGGNLVLNGNNSAATTQAVAGLLLNTTGGSNTITLNKGAGSDDILLTLGAITRANSGQDATIRFFLPAGAQSATGGITTTSPNSTFGTLGTAATATADAAYATVNDGTGTWFATGLSNGSTNNVVALASTAKNTIATWAAGDHITDETTGFTGTLQCAGINTLRFNATSGSDVNLAAGGVLLVRAGGILVTDQVTSGTPGIFDGSLVSDVTELVVTTDSSQTFEISSFIGAQQGITKSGTGTLLLSGKNNFNQETEIHDGTLQAAGGDAIFDHSILTLAFNRDSTFELLADETIGRLQGGKRAGVAGGDYGTVAIGSHTLNINQTSSTTYGGFFTGTGAIVKQGSADLNMQNTSTGFTGAVVIDSGTFRLSNAATTAASSFTVNKGGSLYLDQTSTTRSNARILNTTPITLNSADGTFNYVGTTFSSPSTVVRGLAIRNDQDGTSDETVGDVNVNSGASYVGMDTNDANDDSDIIASNVLRFNDATLNVRGTNLGSTLAQNNQFRIVSANEAAFDTAANLVGGNGAAGSQNIDIVPWAIGETFAGAIGAGNMGNSLVTYVNGAGFRPLDFATEYDTIALAAADDNARESLGADLTGLAGKTVNSLVINNAAFAGLDVTGAGAAQTLDVTSGAMLFTISGAAANTAYDTTLGGFGSGITVGGTNEYVISVVNPNTTADLTGGSTAVGSTRVTVASTAGLAPGMAVFGQGIPVGATVVAVNSATTFEISLPADIAFSGQTYRYSDNASLTATISSNLTTSADITKSGRGALILSGANSAGGGSNKTTLNEGTLQIASLANIGGNTGDLVFAGGGLRFDSGGFTGDISDRTISFLQGGATIDTNGLSLALANSVGSGVGGLTKTGAGNLTLNAAATYTGPTTILGGTLTVGANNATGVGGDLNIGAGAIFDIGANSITAGLVSTFGTAAPTLSGTGTITASDGFFFTHRSGATVTVDALLAGTGGLFKNEGGAVTLTGANSYTGRTEVQNGTVSFNSIANVGAGASALGAPATVADGVIHTGLGGNASTLTYTGTGHGTDRIIQMNGTTGGLTINGNGSGALALGAIQTTISGNKTLTLGGTSALALENSVASIKQIGGALSLSKTGANTWVVNGANNYTGATTAGGGVLRAANNLAFSTSAVTLINTGAVLELADGINVANDLTVSATGDNKILRLRSGATSATWSGTIGNAETVATNFDVSADTGGTLTLSGVISGVGGLTKEGLGTAVLTAANTYAAATAVNGGTLRLGDGGAGGSLATGSAISIASGATFAVDQNDTVTQGTDFSAAAITGGGGFEQAGTGTTVLNAANTYTGPTAVSAGQLSLESSLTSDVAVALGATLATETATLASTTGDIDLLTGSIGEFTLFSDPNAGGAGIGVAGTNHSAWSAANFDFGDVTINFLEDTAGLGLDLDLGDEFGLLQWSTAFNLSGTTTFSMLPTLVVGLTWDTTSRWASEGVIVIIPEPSRALLLLLGGLAMILRRRRPS